MELHISLSAETLFHVGPIPVTNSMVTMFLVMAAILIVFTLIARSATAVPGRAQSIVELIIEFIDGLVESTAGKRMGRRLLPLISGIFIFILFANFSGLLPGMGTIGKWEEHEADDESHAEETLTSNDNATPEAAVAGQAVNDDSDDGDGGVAATTENGDTGADDEHEKTLVPYFRAPTADINMTLAMSLLTFVLVQILGVGAHGVVGRIKHMADPPFLFPIEVISELSRIISLSARLFGNVFAGEVLLGVMYAMGAAIKVALVPFLFPVVFMGLEVLFGTIQALVFALLTLIYIVLAVGTQHEEHDGEKSHEPKAHDLSGHEVPVGVHGD